MLIIKCKISKDKLLNNSKSLLNITIYIRFQHIQSAEVTLTLFIYDFDFKMKTICVYATRSNYT